MSPTRLALAGARIEPGAITVDADVAHHARVSRVAPGDPIELLDLAGTVGVGRLERWIGKQCLVVVEEILRDRGEPPASLTLALGLLHTDAFAWAVEKATEMGVTTILPVLTERVQRRNHDRRVERWRRIAEAAVCQCGRSRIPTVAEPLPLAEMIAAAPSARLVADWSGASDVPLDRDGASAGMTVLVGPEGGLTDDERALALEAGFVPLALGPRTLRAETAAVAALAAAQRLAGWPGF